MPTGRCYKAAGIEPAREGWGEAWSAQKRSREAGSVQIVPSRSGGQPLETLGWWGRPSRPPRVFGGGTRVIRSRITAALLRGLALVLVSTGLAGASEANLILPDLASESFLGVDGWTLLLVMGAIICAFGLVFSFIQYNSLKNLPVHRAMREISELIYETCKTYLITQGKFILLLEVF